MSNKNQAVRAFKSGVDAIQEYFLSQGIDIPRHHLLEAGSRFEGDPNWRTTRAILDRLPRQDRALGAFRKEIKPLPSVRIPDGKEFNLFVDVKNPRSGMDMSEIMLWQERLDEMLEARLECEGTYVIKTLAPYYESAGVGFFREDRFITTHTIEAVLTRSHFCFTGVEADTGEILSTEPLSFERLLALINGAIHKTPPSELPYSNKVIEYLKREYPKSFGDPDGLILAVWNPQGFDFMANS